MFCETDLVEPLGALVVLAAFAAATGTLGLMWYLRQYRETVSARWFILTLGAQAVVAAAYGVGLLTFDPVLRRYAEASVWIGLVWLGPSFLAFALSYTGRTDLFRSRGFRLLFAVPAAGSLLALTHPAHDLLWRGFRLSPLFEVATVRYAIHPLGYALALASLAAAAVAVLLLVETIVAYGPLYRREAIAVAVSTLPPAAAFVVWLAGVGPWPELNLGVAMLIPHVLFDTYAFVGTHMFETNPTTQRAAARSALDDLDSPLLVVDTDSRVVKLNDRAASLFDVDSTARRPTDFERLIGVDLETVLRDGEIEVDGERGAVFSVSYTELTDPAGTEVGGLVVLYDISTERQQTQQLDVLNRILRHNLRNELTVILGRARLIESSPDADPGSQARTIRQAGERLQSISEKARDFARVVERDVQSVDVDLDSIVADVVEASSDEHPAASVDVDIDVSRPTVRSDPELLSLTLSTLVENAVVHAPTEPTVSVRVTDGADGTIRIEIRDSNPEIDAAELAPIESGTETALEHGSGIGLWVATWCVSALGGDLHFRYEDGNVAVVDVPAGDEPDSEA